MLLQDSQKEKTAGEKFAASKTLIKTFGQKKGERFYNQQDQNEVGASEVEDKIEKAVEAVDKAALVEASLAAAVCVLPKRSEEATTVEAVYRLEDMLTQTDIQKLQLAWREMKPEQEFSELTTALLAKCGVEKVEGDTRLAVILYMEGIIKLSKLRAGQLRRPLDSLPAFLPAELRKRLVGRFLQRAGDGSTHLVTPELRDRALCHIIVLGLLANKFQV